MTPMRWFYVIFWLFVGTMLAWQAYDYNANLIAQAKAHPPPAHYFYNADPAASTPQAPRGPHVIQRNFSIDAENPPGNFTCHVTLKNDGDAKAVSVQILVRPFRGIPKSGQQGHAGNPLDDQDPISQISQWLAFPDLAPGESSTQDVIFTDQPGISQTDTPGMNPNPQILFQPEKPKP